MCAYRCSFCINSIGVLCFWYVYRALICCYSFISWGVAWQNNISGEGGCQLFLPVNEFDTEKGNHIPVAYFRRLKNETIRFRVVKVFTDVAEKGRQRKYPSGRKHCSRKSCGSQSPDGGGLRCACAVILPSRDVAACRIGNMKADCSEKCDKFGWCRVEKFAGDERTERRPRKYDSSVVLRPELRTRAGRNDPYEPKVSKRIRAARKAARILFRDESDYFTVFMYSISSITLLE